MERIEYRDVRDRSEWTHGPWDDEPDKIQWQDVATGLPCLIVRNLMGALCGYVGVPEGHPAYGRGYDELDGDLDVHGGLSFAAPCSEGAEAGAICHVPAPGESDRVWWLGFDCGHAYDKYPAQRRQIPGLEETYRDVAFVTAQCELLAAQLKARMP